MSTVKSLPVQPVNKVDSVNSGEVPTGGNISEYCLLQVLKLNRRMDGWRHRHSAELKIRGISAAGPGPEEGV